MEMRICKLNTIKMKRIILGIFILFSVKSFSQTGLVNLLMMNNKVESTYYLRQILPDNPANTPEQSDGASLVPYQGNLLQMFGWLGGPQSAKVYSSSDLGRNFSSLPDAPEASAEQLAQVRNDGKLWVWPTPSGKIYNYDGTWHLVSTNFVSTSSGIYLIVNDKLTVIGGQSVVSGSPVNDNNVYQYDDANDVWNVIGQTPTGVWLCTGCAWVIGSDIYATGGGSITSFTGTYDFLNDKIIKSSDGGVTWSVFATLPVGMRAMWPEVCRFDGKVWYINGFSSGANQTGVYKSKNNGAAWDLFTNNISGRHATSVIEYDNSLYIGWGNFHNDLYRIEKIVYPVQGFAVPQVQTWWEKEWPADRPTDTLLTAINNFFNTLNTDISLNPLKTQLQVLDYVSLVAGVNDENQFLIPLISSNSSYFNSAVKAGGSPTWSKSTGAYSTLGGPVYQLNWSPFTNGVNYTQNNASGFEYILSNLSGEVYEFGNGSYYMEAHSLDNGGRFYGAINSGDFAIEGVTSGKGYRGMSRLSSASVDVVINSTHNAIIQNSSSFGAAKFSMCGAYIYGSVHHFGAIGMGSGELDHDKMRVAIQAFFTETGVSY